MVSSFDLLYMYCHLRFYHASNLVTLTTIDVLSLGNIFQYSKLFLFNLEKNPHYPFCKW